jgi:hypothetical protein
MITHQDQMNLWNLISKKLTFDVTCYAFGGNAMMFYGYKGETKDIDLLFETEKARQEFVRVLELLGYSKISPKGIYIPEKLRDKDDPLMYQLDDARFDLFVKKIIHITLSQRMKEDFFALHEFKGKHALNVHVLRKEHLVLLKAVTERDRDFEDIITILRKEKNFDWQYLIDETLWQFEHGDSWALIDVEKMLRELKEYVFVPEKYVKQLLGKKA